MKSVKEFLKTNKDFSFKLSEIIKVSKNRGLIKPHTEAFKEFPAKDEFINKSNEKLCS